MSYTFNIDPIIETPKGYRIQLKTKRAEMSNFLIKNIREVFDDRDDRVSMFADIYQNGDKITTIEIPEEDWDSPPKFKRLFMHWGLYHYCRPGGADLHRLKFHVLNQLEKYQ
jgi:hypothetical protein